MSSNDHTRRPPRQRGAALIAAGGVFAASAFIGLIPTMASASSHREAPLTAADPAIDNTDLYAFVDPTDPTKVNLIGNWTPFEEPNGGPNFYPWAAGAAYDFNIDNDGDAKADVVYRMVFSTQDARGTNTFLYNNGPVTSLTDENLLFRQTYDLTVSTEGGPFAMVLDNAPVAPSFTGKAGMPDYEALRKQAITPLPGGGQVVAAQADDSFFLDLRVFDLLYGGDLSEVGQDTLAGYNTNTIALQVPTAAVAMNGNATKNPVFGVWSTTSRPSISTRNADGTITASGPLQQVSRLGQPLVNEVVVPTGLKDTFNAIPPTVDATVPAVVDRVLKPELPALIEGIYKVKAPATPRNDIAQVFLTGITTKIPALAPGGTAPLPIDLNSQAMNGDFVAGTFQPSEMLRLNTSIPPTPADKQSRLGVVGGDLQGFPNGRRLGDDVLDISVLALEGVYNVTDFPKNIPADRVAAGVAALAAGDKVDKNDNAFSNVFPYVSLPNRGAVNGGGGTGGGGLSPVPPAGAAVAPKPSAAPTKGAATKPGAYPTGGVDTGAGGWDNALMPALTGGMAVLLLGAGAGSLIRNRALRTSTTTPEA
ncbi:DUF4331 domain-containing protein [Modestobacter sp. I12A-02628]|uniref:DUF4331 domain-containing protein n=1 Tax=Goekera deserti TaxID=2497753 RepID=A0A7K3WBN3_9ACTN|nr:DUF4331 domain-containing protein [Goekera deserti]MPQ97363.1 DUF4331 domain-containing protein [Goekera deserti]NDI48036.1 DUF4331 domain-containing protein [Goekera deserti]NEL53784.1 DUF4331 domain-containing protein [Goekera deserti]